MAREKKSKRAVPVKKELSKPKGFWRAAKAVIWNEKNTEQRFTVAALSLTISVFLNFIALILAIYGAIGVLAGIYAVCMSVASSFSGIVMALNIVVCSIAALLFALVLRGMANEAGRETDTNYLVALFSGLTGFAALVVALIALKKG